MYVLYSNTITILNSKHTKTIHPEDTSSFSFFLTLKVTIFIQYILWRKEGMGKERHKEKKGWRGEEKKGN